MNPAKIALKNRTTTLVLTLLVIGMGINSYLHLGRLEFPDFVIKTSVIVTPYPGASSEQVEQEVTDVLEEAVQSLGELDEIHSTSQDGLSIIHADMKEKYQGEKELQQIWDKLRRKVNDAQAELPSGAGPSIVNDDFGDVYGLFYAITGEGYSYEDLKEYGESLKKQLLRCDDVAKISFSGTQPEVIYIEVAQARIAKLGISPQVVLQLLQSQNIVQPSGNVMVGENYVRIEPTGEFNSEERIGDLLIVSPVTGAGMRLRDIAEVRRGYLDPPVSIMRFNGRPAIGMGISTVAGGNAVVMGNSVKARLDELQSMRPAGVNVEILYDQGATVNVAVNDFMINLIESVLIVIALLLIFMGWRSGLLIGIVLVLTILATFIYMWLAEITLQKISLGALVLALGMLVDNAIVVVEGVLVRLKRGVDHETAAIETVQQTQWPLLGATFIAALAFAAIGLAPGNVGEFCVSLFWVLASSLMISWLTAVTITPMLCVWMLKASSDSSADVDPYDMPFFRLYRRVLDRIIRYWPATLAVILGAVIAAVIAFGYVPSFFFPESNQPLFTVKLFRPQGTHITHTSDSIRKIEAHLSEEPSVERVSAFIGQGTLRFILTYTPEDINASFGSLIVSVDKLENMYDVLERLNDYLDAEFADAEYVVERWKDGPPYDYAIEARFRGPDAEVLRGLSEQAKSIMREEGAGVVRDNWRNRTTVLRPDFSEAAARQTGLTRNDLAQALRLNFGGQVVGVYREGNDLLPMILRSNSEESDTYQDARQIYTWSLLHNESVPLDVVVSDWSRESTWQDSLIHRRHREREITAQCNPQSGLASVLLKKVMPRIEQMDLPAGYELEWGGEFEASANGTEPLAAMFPICLGGMFVILIVLFNDLRQPIIIFLCLPMITVGVTTGLLLTGLPFGFMSILGYLGLSGMLIKNAIVLIDEVEANKASGTTPYTAVLDAGVSRLRPVVMASGTTVLGMLPLIWDPFYKGMAVTVASGLIGSTILTLLVVPLFYVLMFRIKSDENKA
ncbi:Toluene efflux pump membrane transporter TtgB [Novipirellula aureliae]|uniref:Toluene efflux pump membrane transporter TtgB n=1 Tax=Novipirellula aureliae TaxID=2527966 RepID=A0A5C6DXW2_9BACT|nr:efflux RND transporter permease subunit [Novipirellula aureliae]TWU40231.1 Toluene efflux pump membrane transporter TtgB [Novipirellula aureliae]